MSLPAITLRMDLTGTAFGGTPTWSDQSSYLETGADGAPISITWGRQDEDSEVQPSSCSFVLDNTDGRWTPGNAAADVDWDVGTPVNIRVTHNAVTYDRFTGYVDSVTPAFPGFDWSRVVVSCTDVLARLGGRNELRPIPEHEILEDNPLGLWRCHDVGGSNYAASAVSGVRAGRKYLGGPRGREDSASFGGPEGGGLLANDPSGSFAVHGTRGTTVTTRNESGGYLDTGRAGTFISVSAGHGCSFGGWINVADADTNLFGSLFQQANSSGVVQAYAWLWGDSPSGGYWIEAGVGTGGVSGITNSRIVTDGDWHHWMVTVPANGGAVKLYIDGRLTGTGTSSGLVSGGTVQTWGGHASPAGYWLNGAMKYVGVFNAELSAARVLSHFQTGAGPAERTDQRFSRLAGYAGLTVASLPTGLAMVSTQVTGGVPAIDALRQVGRSENAPVYATKSGALTMQARSQRLNAAVAATITDADIDPDFQAPHDREGLVNQATVTFKAGEQDVTDTDTTSRSRHGYFDLDVDTALSTENEATALAQWKVETGKNPLTRIPDLNVDLLTGQSVAFVTSMLALDISSKVQLTGLPDQAKASTYTGFVEGGTESLGVTEWRMGLYNTPVTLEDSLLIYDDATKGVYDSTRVYGI